MYGRRRLSRLLLWPGLVTVLLASPACDESDELRNIDRGTDERPAIEATPPEEGQ